MTRAMKDSGIEWIGEIPEEWNLVQLKRFASINNGYEIIEEIDKNADAIPVYGSGGIFKYTTQALYDGETVMFGRKGTLGKPIYANGKFWTIDTMYYLTFSDKLYPRFNYYQLISFDWTPHITQTALPSIVGSEIISCQFAFPSIKEQQRIANFLDTECSRIDAVIGQTRASIEEYKKLKQAVITQAVTKGIRPNRPMKDSGIKWVKQIPLEWKLTKIKYISSGVGDGLHAAPEFEVNGLYYFINGNNLGDKQIKIKDNTNSVSEEEYSKYNQPVLCSNAILIALNGTYGSVSFYNGERIMLGKSAGYINLFPNINRNFVRYVLLSDYLQRQLDDSLAGTTIANISLRTIRNLSIIWPPENEQKEISMYLDAKCKEFDKLLLRKIQLLSELETYKKSLIYEYVTGKKEVGNET